MLVAIEGTGEGEGMATCASLYSALGCWVDNPLPRCVEVWVLVGQRSRAQSLLGQRRRLSLAWWVGVRLEHSTSRGVSVLAS